MRNYGFIITAVILVCASGSLNAQNNANIEKNKAFIQAFNEDFWNKHNIAAFEKYFSADFISHYPDVDMNAEQVKGLCQAYFSAFPDLHITMDDMIAEGDRVVKVWTANCTSKGEFMGIPATGQPIVVKGIEVFRIVDGKIAENWVSMDNLGMLQQLGVIPPMGE